MIKTTARFLKNVWPFFNIMSEKTFVKCIKMRIWLSESSFFPEYWQGLIQKEKVDIDGKKGAQISVVTKRL